MPIIVGIPVVTPANLTSDLAALAWDYLPQYIKAADDGTLLALLTAVGVPVSGEVSTATDASYTSDEYTTPLDRLAWLAAMAGIDLSTVPNDRKRAIVGDASWRYRGSLDAIRKRVGETLTGAKNVEIVTNYLGDPDAISVTTFASQTPDEPATEAAIRAELPAWMAATIVTDAAGQSYTNLAADYATYGAMTTTGKSYGTLSQEV